MSNLKKNILYNSTYQLLLIVLPIITSPYVSRILGAKNIGIFSYSQAFANYFYLFSMLGVKNYGNRTIAKTRDNVILLRKNFWEIYSFQIIFGILISIIYLLSVHYYIDSYKKIYYLQSMFVLSGVFDLTWCYFGLEQFKKTATISMVIKIIDVIAIFLLVNSDESLYLYTLLICLAMISNQIILIPNILKQIPFKKPTIKGIMCHVKPNVVMFIPVLAVSFYNIMDKIMLGAISTKTEVGLYTYAENIAQIPNTLILSVNNAIMPRMSNLVGMGDKKNSKSLMDHLMIVAMFISVGCAFGLMATSRTLIPWFYGEEFNRCSSFVMVISPIIIFKGWAGVLRTQYIIPYEKDKIFIFSLFIGAFINIVINYFLIPKYNGMGAIIGTLIAEFSVCLAQFTMIHKEIYILNYLKDGFFFLFAGIIMIIWIMLLNFLPFGSIKVMFIQIITGGFLYLAICSVYLINKKGLEINYFIKFRRD